MRETAQPFDVALATIRAGNLFTKHTAVAAGFDRFEPDFIERYLGRYAADGLGITMQDLLALGRQAPSDPSEPFNMAYLAVRGSGAVNAVSRLHGYAGKHGAADATILHEPRGTRVYRATLPAGCRGLPGTRHRQGGAWQAGSGLAARDRRGVIRYPLR